MATWDQMGPAEFGRPEHHVQTAFMLTAADGTALTPGADPMGTLDLFGIEDQADEPDTCRQHPDGCANYPDTDHTPAAADEPAAPGRHHAAATEWLGRESTPADGVLADPATTAPTPADIAQEARRTARRAQLSKMTKPDLIRLCRTGVIRPGGGRSYIEGGMYPLAQWSKADIIAAIMSAEFPAST